MTASICDGHFFHLLKFGLSRQMKTWQQAVEVQALNTCPGTDRSRHRWQHVPLSFTVLLLVSVLYS